MDYVWQNPDMGLGEFGRIDRFFRPLAQGFAGSLGLNDDAALVKLPPDREMVISVDALVEGIHVPYGAPPDFFAHKALRTNLSDLAAKGATPLCYFLTLCLPPDRDDNWVASFAGALSADQHEFAIHLAGGDSVSTNGPVVISITVIGTVPEGGMVRRDRARIGDMIYVTGYIGQGALGLSDVRKSSGNVAAGMSGAVAHYWKPRPRLDLIDFMRRHAHAAADISDGLVADLENICRASHVSAQIDLNAVPISDEARLAVQTSAFSLIDLMTAGDDYELVFAGPAGLEHIARVFPIGIIKPFQEGNFISVYCGDTLVSVDRKGWGHY